MNSVSLQAGTSMLQTLNMTDQPALSYHTNSRPPSARNVRAKNNAILEGTQSHQTDIPCRNFTSVQSIRYYITNLAVQRGADSEFFQSESSPIQKIESDSVLICKFFDNLQYDPVLIRISKTMYSFSQCLFCLMKQKQELFCLWPNTIRLWRNSSINAFAS